MCTPTAATMEEVVEFGRSYNHETRTETILLVEDEAFVREVTCEVLRSAGYQVLTAKNADEAMQAHERQSGEVDLLLTDVVLPGEDGLAVANRLTEWSPGLKVLYVTGYGERMRLGCADGSDWLAKPFSSEVLLARVRQLLDHSRVWLGNGAGQFAEKLA